VYDPAVRALVGAWKERGLRGIAQLAAELATETLDRPDAEALTFVPADAERRRKRGHHPAERLARGLAKRWALPVAPLLVRTGSGERQRGLDRAARRRNVAGAFVPRAAAPKAVCLVDDVYTSGATVAAAASALRRAGAGRIVVVTLARAVRHG
jgi:predicted amidophosphoribosyltransferase